MGVVVLSIGEILKGVDKGGFDFPVRAVNTSLVVDQITVELVLNVNHRVSVINERMKLLVAL